MGHKRLGIKIKRLRSERGMTQESLAKRARISREYVARLELGQHDPGLSTLIRLAKALGISVGNLVDLGKEVMRR